MLTVIDQRYMTDVRREVQEQGRYMRIGHDVGWVIGRLLIKSSWMPNWLFMFLWRKVR